MHARVSARMRPVQSFGRQVDARHDLDVDVCKHKGDMTNKEQRRPERRTRGRERDEQALERHQDSSTAATAELTLPGAH